MRFFLFRQPFSQYFRAIYRLCLFICWVAQSSSLMHAKPDSGLVLIPGGCFQMGTTVLTYYEKPVHRVCLDTFWLESSEVSQESYLKKARKRPVFNRKNCGNCPAEYISWFEAKKYCESLGRRLPSEAEWEYALRKGSGDSIYRSDTLLNESAWYQPNSRERSHPVALKRPNTLQLYDMQGNVWEWCSDWFAGNYYKISDTYNPKGPDTGNEKVLRGGSFLNTKRKLSPAFRFRRRPLDKDLNIGFRCAKDYVSPK